MTSNVAIWSDQQNAFFDECETGKGSIILEAVAGAGKTTSILEAATNRISGSVGILAYNKKIADEINEKLKKKGVDWKKVRAGTVHSMGFGLYRKAFPSVRVDGEKLELLFDSYFEKENIVTPYSGTVKRLVSLAKQEAIGLIRSINDVDAWREIWDHYDLLSDLDEEKLPIDAIFEAAQKLLMVSNRQTDMIDFDDMVYLPLIHKIKIYGFDAVFVDEAQDTNASRRLLCTALVNKGGRLIAVGDPMQAIYGFTGASHDALDQIALRHKAKRMPLSVSYRCPKAVVKFAQQWNPVIESHPNAIDGSVETIDLPYLFVRKDLNADAAVLCRNNKPLVELAFKLIRSKIACKVEGRDIGNGLKKLATRWSNVKNITALETRLDAYKAAEKKKLETDKKYGAKYQVIEDQIETLRVIMGQCTHEGKLLVSDVLDYIESLFSDNVKDVLTLTSIHKAKGKEWKRVFWLDRKGTMPSKYAKQPWQMVQETNLMYVAATRAMESLIELKV